MAKLIKPWNDGGNLTVTYDDNGGDSATFESDSYEGIDRKTVVTFKGGEVEEEVIVIQEGIRQPIGLSGGGIFRLANGGRFGVLKEGGVEPPAPLYEEIEYVTLDGMNVFDTQYKGNNKTTIEIKFERSSITTNVYLLGSSGTSTTYLNAYMASNGNWRYGNYQKIYNTRQKKVFVAEMTPGKITVDGVSGEFTPIEFTTSNTLAVGGRKTSTVFDNLFQGYIYYFRMSIDGVLVADWIPVRRLSDGLECFWDKVTQSFVEPIIQ